MGWLVGLPLGLFRLLGGGVLLAVRIFWPVLLGLAAAALVRRMRRRRKRTARKERPPREPHFDGPVYTVEYQEVCQQPLSQEPDGPEPFGYKTGWLAIRCQDPRRVLEALGGTDVRPANWKTGPCRRGRARAARRLCPFAGRLGAGRGAFGAGRGPGAAGTAGSGI